MLHEIDNNVRQRGGEAGEAPQLGDGPSEEVAVVIGGEEGNQGQNRAAQRLDEAQRSWPGQGREKGPDSGAAWGCGQRHGSGILEGGKAPAGAYHPFPQIVSDPGDWLWMRDLLSQEFVCAG